MSTKTVDMESSTVTRDRPGPASRNGSIDGARQTAAPDVVLDDGRSPRLTDESATLRRKRGFPPIRLLTFILFVLVPFAAALAYYTVLATDQFISESRFAVRSFDTGSKNSSAALGASISMMPLQQDAYVVTSFIHSPEILRRLAMKIDLRALFERSEIDWYSRLPANATPEEFLDYWDDQVVTYVDGPSGIITVKVRAFSPQDAQRIGKLIIAESETLANELSERARTDIVARATSEVKDREVSYRKALQDLNSYQNTSGILSPEAKAGETGTLLTGLMAKKLEVDSRLFVLRQSVDDTAPNVVQLQNTQDSLAKQINVLRAQLAAEGTVSENLSDALNRFSALETERVISEALYSAARRNLQAAKTEALRKSVYITVFVTPTLPDDPRFPKRVETPLLILLGLSVLWATLVLAWASVEDHRL